VVLFQGDVEDELHMLGKYRSFVVWCSVRQQFRGMDERK